jgi:hypothetical protein
VTRSGDRATTATVTRSRPCHNSDRYTVKTVPQQQVKIVPQQQILARNPELFVLDFHCAQLYLLSKTP